MTKMKTAFLGVLFISLGIFSACDKNGDFLLFSLENDMALGEQVKEEIAADPDQYPILDRVQYATAYSILDGMLDDILTSGQVTYAEEFNWELFIIDDDQTLNAFATPGGKIYVYTGLVYFLDHADDLMGVMGHEVAHADQRHSSKQLQRTYGISILLSILAGENASQLTQIAGQLAGSLGGLAFSREAEAEADDFSVVYLGSTAYACNGAAAFFDKIVSSGDPRGPEFLSTHPDPGNRVEDINAKATEEGCEITLHDEDKSELLMLKNALP